MRRAVPAAEAALEAQEEAASEPPPEQPEQPEKQPPPPPPLSQQPPPAATAAALDMLRKLDPAQTEESAKAWESAFGMSPTPLPQWYNIQEGDIIKTNEDGKLILGGSNHFTVLSFSKSMAEDFDFCLTVLYFKHLIKN